MIVLYGGRMVLERRNLVENWRAIIKLPLRDKTFIDLYTPDLRQAFIRAQHHYIALKTDTSVEEVECEQSNQLRCWTCIHWLPRSNNCVFEFPEARQTGGKYAAKCEIYSDGTKSFGQADARAKLLD